MIIMAGICIIHSKMAYFELSERTEMDFSKMTITVYNGHQAVMSYFT